MSERTIQCIRIFQYGGPEVLQLERVERSVPKANEVLVRVHAAGVNPVDWKIRQGYMQGMFSLNFPYIPGRDLAGVIEEVGADVTSFQVGQAVYGQSAYGTYTEYTAASVNTLAPKPKTLSYDEAAAIPVGATTAWQGLFDHGGLQAGQRVLIQGGAGGVGIFAVQFARWRGAHVIATTSTANVDFVRSLGADEVINYTKTPVESAVHDVDLVFDGVGGPTLEASLQAVKRGGTLVTIAGQPSQADAEARGVRVIRFSANVSSQLLQTFTQLIDSGKVKLFVQKTFPLSEARQAQELSQHGHGRGRIVLHIAD